MALILIVCEVAGARDLVGDARIALRHAGVLEAIRAHDDAAIFDWLMRAISFQGVSDAAASGYMDLHGSANAAEITEQLAKGPGCAKLQRFNAFHDCGYRKIQATCSNPRLLGKCPVPQLDLRNGSLNQAAYRS